MFLCKGGKTTQNKMSQKIQNNSMSQVYLIPKVWGPHYWFFLHSLTLSYPETPNEVVKRKYYDFIHNLPLFLPVGGAKFAEMLDLYPVTPYLDCRQSFVRWMVFIHNKYNHLVGNPPMDIMEALDHYYDSYKSPEILEEEITILQRHHIVLFLLALFGVMYFWIK